MTFTYSQGVAIFFQDKNLSPIFFQANNSVQLLPIIEKINLKEFKQSIHQLINCFNDVSETMIYFQKQLFFEIRWIESLSQSVACKASEAQSFQYIAGGHQQKNNHDISRLLLDVPKCHWESSDLLALLLVIFSIRSL